jgi:hypothetical protein
MRLSAGTIICHAILPRSRCVLRPYVAGEPGHVWVGRIAIAGARGLVGREVQAILGDRGVGTSVIDTSGEPTECELAFLCVPDKVETMYSSVICV